MTSIWRLNIKTAAKNGIDPREFCLQKGILGIGWQVNQSGSVTWEDYFDEARAKYKARGRSFVTAINVLKQRMKIGDLCWTRDRDGIYYLGVIRSDWRYDSSAQNVAADVTNIRSCTWLKAGTVDVVPGKVVNSYISGSTVQKVNGMNVLCYSKYLANSLAGESLYELGALEDDFLSLISSDDCEDIVSFYMQKELGLMLISSSCKSDTATYEYVMKHRITGEKAVAQVKHGNLDLDCEAYSNIEAMVVLLTTRGKYIGEKGDNVLCLKPSEIVSFAVDNYLLMSDRVQNWIRFYREAKQSRLLGALSL